MCMQSDRCREACWNFHHDVGTKPGRKSRRNQVMTSLPETITHQAITHCAGRESLLRHHDEVSSRLPGPTLTKMDLTWPPSILSNMIQRRAFSLEPSQVPCPSVGIRGQSRVRRRDKDALFDRARPNRGFDRPKYTEGYNLPISNMNWNRLVVDSRSGKETKQKCR
jgi:hypothetical protein